MGDRLATIDMGRKVGAAVPLLGRELDHHLTQCAWAEAYLHSKWHLDPSNRLATTDMGQNVGAAVPLLGRELGAHLTQFVARAKRTSMPNFVMIQPTVWPQYTKVTDRWTGTDRQCFDSIGQTILQMVTQKWLNQSGCCLAYGLG